MLTTCLLYGQEADSTRRVQWHLGTGATVASGFGRTQGLMWVAPSVEYQASPKLTLRGGFATAGTLIGADYQLQGRQPRSLAPRKQGTRAGAVWAAAEYHPNDRLWLWASAKLLFGYMQPLWLDHSLPLQAAALSGGFAYRFDNDQLLEMHVSIVRDRYGSTFGLMYNPYCDPLVPTFDLYPPPFF